MMKNDVTTELQQGIRGLKTPFLFRPDWLTWGVQAINNI